MWRMRTKGTPALALTVGLLTLGTGVTPPRVAGKPQGDGAAPPLVRSARSGPWSAPATWEGGKVPGAGSKSRSAADTR
jgi:hypothetical protein